MASPSTKTMSNGNSSHQSDKHAALDYLKALKRGEKAERPQITDEHILEELNTADFLNLQAGANTERRESMYTGLGMAEDNQGRKQFPLFAEVLAEAARDARRKLATMTLAELLIKELPPARWAVPDLISEGLTILGGKPKLGKSWLILGIALAVASGGYALGKKQVEQGEVLYLSLEDNERRLQKRVQLLCASLSGVPEGLHLATSWARADAGGLPELEQWIIEHPKARLIIIDTWARFAPRQRRQGRVQYDEDYDALVPVKELADKYGIAIVVIMHMRKMASTDIIDEISGSVGVTGAVDGILGLRRERGQFTASLFVTGRDIEDEQEYALAFDKATAVWTLEGTYEQVARTKARQEILDVLKDGSWMTKGEIADALGKNIDTTRNHLKELMKDGMVIRQGYKYARKTSQPSQLFGDKPPEWFEPPANLASHLASPVEKTSQLTDLIRQFTEEEEEGYTGLKPLSLVPNEDES